jgi:hypothetical protein
MAVRFSIADQAASSRGTACSTTFGVFQEEGAMAGAAIHHLKPSLIKSAIRARFFLTGRKRASDQIRTALAQYLSLVQGVGPEDGRRAVRVPPMLGVDEDMRDWSLFMILEHNAIVNRSITATLECLARGEKPSGVGVVDPKRDVMPSADPGEEQIQAFQASVETHLKVVSGLRRLRSTRTSRHPLFGQLNAHGWHCMFGFHLEIHRRQAKAVSDIIHQGSAGERG